MNDTHAVLRAEVSSVIYQAKTTLKDKQATRDSLVNVIALLPKSTSSPSSSTLHANINDARKIFVTEHYDNFVEFLAELFKPSWLETDDSGYRLVELFDKCFLLGPDDDSFLMLSRIISSTEKLSVCTLHCISILKLLLKNNCLSRILHDYCCTKPSSECGHHSKTSDRDLSRNPQWQTLLTVIASLPDVISAKAQAGEVGDFFLPEIYVRFIVAESMTVLRAIYQKLHNGTDVSVTFLASLFAKLSLSGFAEPLWKQLIAELETLCVNDFLWRRIVQRIISGIPDRCVESVAVQLVLHTSSYVALKAFLGTTPITSSKLTYVLTHKLILVRCYSGKRAIHVLRNIAGYLTQTVELSEQFISTFRLLLVAWADNSSLRHRPVEQSLYLSKAILTFLTFASPAAVEKLRTDIQRYLLDGLPGYLGSSIVDIRQMGSFVAEKLSGSIHRENEGEPLLFGLEENELINSLAQLCEFPNIDEINKLYAQDLVLTDSTQSNGHTENGLASESLAAAAALSTEQSNSKISDVLDSDDDDDDYFNDLKPYPSSTTEPENAKCPLYLAQCIEGLLKPDDPESVELCLTAVGSLIRKADPKTILELAVELCRILLNLDDRYAIINFVSLRLRAMVSVTVMCPAAVAEYLGTEFYARNYNIRQRMDILDVLASAASELSEPPRSNDDPSLLEAGEKLSALNIVGSNEPPTHWTEIVRSRIELKTRRFAKGRTQPLPVVAANKFAPVAGSFFYPLLRHFDGRTDACLDLLGTDHLLLERLFYAVGSIVLAAVHAPCAHRLSSALLAFVRCARYHNEAGVRRAVVYAACTALAVLPSVSVLDDPFVVNDIGDWLRCVTERDPDAECQKRAAQGLLLLSNTVRNHFVDQN